MRMKWAALPGHTEVLVTQDGPFTASVMPKDGEWLWTAVFEPTDQPQRLLGQDLCANRADAQVAAEVKIADFRRPGRPPKLERKMTASERSKLRVGRQAARAVAATALNKGVTSLQHDLRAAGQDEWADQVANVRRVAALRAVAEYTRQNAEFFVAPVTKILNPDERAAHVYRINMVAADLDALADAVAMTGVSYEDFEFILQQLRNAGFWPDNNLVSDVAQAFTI
jgi:hypothetical protein